MTTAIEKILEYFKVHEEVFNDCLEELDSYNGFLGDDRAYSMDEFEDLMEGVEKFDLLRMAFYGNFNPDDEYWWFNRNGNLESGDDKDYSCYLAAYTVKTMLEHRGYIDGIDDDTELSGLFDELEKESA